MATPRSHVAFNRVVFTYEPEGLPLGMVTGFVRDECFYVEHVVVFPYAPASTLLRMTAAGLARLWASDLALRSVAVHWTKNHPNAAGLEVLAERFGFTRYNEDAECVHLARWR
jgi:hypothetical protein